MGNRIVIIGAGGHGKVVYDAIVAQGLYEIVGFVDASVAMETVVIADSKVIAKQSDLNQISALADFCVIAIGNNSIREQAASEAKKFFKLATIIHPASSIGSDVKIEEGTVVLAKAVINASCCIGSNSIINAGVIVDHDCSVGHNVHLSIGTMLGSNSIVADNKLTQIGEVINSFTK